MIKMTEHFYFRGHLCIAMELLSINLYELIKANSFVGFSTGLIRRFTSQMLQSLALMRHHRIVHCDLKPEVCTAMLQWDKHAKTKLVERPAPSSREECDQSHRLRQQLFRA